MNHDNHTKEKSPMSSNDNTTDQAEALKQRNLVRAPEVAKEAIKAFLREVQILADRHQIPGLVVAASVSVEGGNFATQANLTGSAEQVGVALREQLARLIDTPQGGAILGIVLEQLSHRGAPDAEPQRTPGGRPRIVK